MTTPFTEMFPMLDLNTFGDAEVHGVSVSRERAEMEIRLEAPRPVDRAEVDALEDAVRREYGLRRVTVRMLSEVLEPKTPDVPRAVQSAPIARAASSRAPGSPLARASGTRAAIKSVLLGKPPTGSLVAMSELDLSLARVTVRGTVFSVQNRELQGRKACVLSFDMTDHTGSIRVSKFISDPEQVGVIHKIKEGMYLTVSGSLTLNRFENNDVTLEPTNIALTEAEESRRDNAPVKRVELHLHTKMSQMDALTDPKLVVERAIAWGHPAIAVTDHGVAHAFPDIMNAAKDKIRPLYGIEGYFSNDVDSRPAVFGETAALPEEITVFDLETTGLSSFTDKITEIAAVTMRGGEIISEFHTYSDPGIPIPAEITSLTGITDETVRGAPDNLSAVRAFLEYADGRALAAHNAAFDVGFLDEICFQNGIAFDPLCFDTLALARAFFPELYNHKLPTVAHALRLPKFDHHRALADASVTGHIMARFLDMLAEQGVTQTAEINRFAYDRLPAKNRERVRHIIIFAQTQAGVRNLYKLITKSHLEHFSRNPIILKSLLMELRDGLLIGSACEAGEIFNLVERGSRYDQHRMARFYDYLEIQPLSNNYFMLRGNRPRAKNEDALRGFNRRILALGQEVNLPVCATGDVHFLDPEDEVYRRILLAAKGYENALESLPIYFRTTEEML
ncbi:MAG: PHP domain-containing protein, partial [Oscillospiraceae bacterium]|nr:PHP domain-containing protein [Oscillospiraceae bacterium]